MRMCSTSEKLLRQRKSQVWKGSHHRREGGARTGLARKKPTVDVGPAVQPGREQGVNRWERNWFQ